MIAEIYDDFDPEQLAESGQCFRWERRPGGVWRIPFRRSCLRLRQAGPHAYVLDCTPEDFRRLWRPYFDLDEDYGRLRARIDPAADPFLARAAEAQRGLRILRQDPWEVIVSFIISQNRNIPAIRRSVELLCRAAGERLTDAAGEDFFAFPGPEAILALPPEALAGCALGYRDRYVLGAAEAVCAGRLEPEALAAAPPEEALETLMGLKGVGIKVASCIALFGLHHTDAFPIDTWMRRVLQNEYPEGYPMERYRPYNGVCQQYMFAYYRNRAGSKDGVK